MLAICRRLFRPANGARWLSTIIIMILLGSQGTEAQLNGMSEGALSLSNRSGLEPKMSAWAQSDDPFAIFLKPASMVSQQSGSVPGTSTETRTMVKAPNGKHSQIALPQEIDGAVWRTDNGFEATIHITNMVQNSLILITPVLFMADGTEYRLPDIELQAAGVARVNVNDALKRVPPEIAAHLSTFGTAALRFVWPWESPIVGAVQSIDVKRSLTFSSIFRVSLHSRENGQARLAGKVRRLDASVIADLSPRPNTIEGLWWKRGLKEDGWFAVTNRSQETIPVRIEAFAAGARQGTSGRQVVLFAHQTQWLHLNEVLADTTGGAQQGGIRIEYRGVPHAIEATGGMENADVGYSAGIPFEPAPTVYGKPESWRIASVGIMEGRPDAMLNFPAGTSFNAYAVLRNISSQSMQVAPTLYLTQGRQAGSGSGRNDQEIAIPAVTLKPGEITSLDLEQALSSNGFQHTSGSLTLCLNLSGIAGGLLAAVGSVDQTGNYVFEVQPHPVSASAGKQIQHFDLLNGNDSMVSLWNHSDQEEELLVAFFFQDGLYKLPVHLAPKQSVMFSVLEIARARTPDLDGNVFPRFITQGTVVVSGPHTVTERINVSINAATFNVQNGTCCDQFTFCEGYLNLHFEQGQTGWIPLSRGASQAINMIGQWSDGNYYRDALATYTSADPSVVGIIGDNPTQDPISNPSLIKGLKGAAPNAIPIYADSWTNIYIANPDCATYSCPIQGEFTDEIDVAVYDPTPAITQVTPSSWNAGTTTQVQILGTGFGTNPTLSITDPSGAVSFVPNPVSDTEIDASITVAGFAPAENANIAVTSNGYNGQPFTSGQGNSQTGNQVTVPITPQVPTVSLSGPTGIPKNGTASLKVTLSPSPSNVPVRVTISTVSGTGSAVYSDGAAFKDVTQTSTLILKGITESSSSNNVLIAAVALISSTPPPPTITMNSTVQKPSALKVISVIVLPDGSDPPAGCGGNNNYGVKIDIKYQVLDQLGSAIQSSIMTPHEAGVFFSGSPFDGDIGPVDGYPTSSKTTAADGTFHDVPLGVCSNLPISNPGRMATQNITTIMPDGTAFPIRSQQFTVVAPGSGSFGHGTISNTITNPGTGSDISATR